MFRILLDLNFADYIRLRVNLFNLKASNAPITPSKKLIGSEKC